MSGVSGGSREGERHRQKLGEKVRGKDSQPLKRMDIFFYLLHIFSFLSFAFFLFFSLSFPLIARLSSNRHPVHGNRLMKEKFIAGPFIFKASFQSDTKRLQLEGESRPSVAVKICPTCPWRVTIAWEILNLIFFKFLHSDKASLVSLLLQSLAFYHSMKSSDIPLLPSPLKVTSPFSTLPLSNVTGLSPGFSLGR